MIDLESRKKAAEVTRRFVAGQITNFELENKFPVSQDLAISAIEDTLWCFYDDFEEHTLCGKWQISEDVKSVMKRWIIFLYSQENYVWPKISRPGVRPVAYGLLGKLLNCNKRQDDFLASGDICFWPFIDEQSYENAKKNPALLAG